MCASGELESGEIVCKIYFVAYRKSYKLPTYFYLRLEGGLLINKVKEWLKKERSIKF